MVGSDNVGPCQRCSQVSQASSKLIRSLISSGLEQMDSTAPAYKVHCLALVASSASTSSSSPTPESKSSAALGAGGPSGAGGQAGQVVCGAGGLEEAYHGWLARHGFVAKMRRCRPIIINVGTRGFLASECPAYLSGIPSIGGTASFWRFSPRKIELGKGLAHGTSCLGFRV